MVLKSEGRQLKFVTEPARDKKYAIIAYSRLLAETVQQCPPETQRELVCGLLELTATQKLGFTVASLATKSAEEMLLDGAIDQTFAFDRQAFVQLTGAKIELADKLDTPDAQVFMMQALQSMCQQTGQSISNYLLEEKHCQ
jgi:hypothetical protein